jgi:CRP/FNR family transcriptional regulator, anaerobic regulatory protein
MFESALQGSTQHEAPEARPTRRAPAEGDVTLAPVRFTDLVALLGIAWPFDAALADVTFPVRRIKAGETLYHAGDHFNSIYVVRSGFFKSVSTDSNGAELVLGFPMAGDVIGLDGVDSGRYLADLVALDISNVAVIPFHQLAHLGHDHPCVERLLYSLFSRELVQKNTMAWVLGTLTAEARIASFLLDLSQRFGRLGYSRTSFALRATREEIGSYLGLKLETVSRTLSGFAASGLIEVQRRQLTLVDLGGLRRILDPKAPDHERRCTRASAPAVTLRAARQPARADSLALAA